MGCGLKINWNKTKQTAHISNMSQVEWGLLLLAIMSSAVTSALGAGGGLMLLVGLPNLVAAPLVIPIHGVWCHGKK